MSEHVGMSPHARGEDRIDHDELVRRARETGFARGPSMVVGVVVGGRVVGADGQVIQVPATRLPATPPPQIPEADAGQAEVDGEAE